MKATRRDILMIGTASAALPLVSANAEIGSIPKGHLRALAPLADAASELGAALDEFRRLNSEFDRITGLVPPSEDVGRFEEERLDPAEGHLERAERRFLGLMRDQGIPAVVVGGRLFVDDSRCLSGDLPDALRGSAIFDAAAIVRLD